MKRKRRNFNTKSNNIDKTITMIKDKTIEEEEVMEEEATEEEVDIKTSNIGIKNKNNLNKRKTPVKIKINF